MLHAGDLEIDEQVEVQEVFWSIQRAMWAVMALIAVTALIGVWGHGWIANASISNPDSGLTVDYERIVRHHADGSLRIVVDGDLTQADTVDVMIAMDWLEGIKIDSIVPEPESMATTEDNAIYTFNVPEPGQPVRVALEYTPVDIGRQQARISVADREPVSFGQFVLP